MFSYIYLEDYELDLNFDGTKIKRKLDHSSDDRVRLFIYIVLVIEK